MQFPHDDTASLIAFYGDPREPGFTANLVLVVPPWHMLYEGRPVRGVQIHKKLAASLEAVFDDIAQQVGRDWTRLPKGAVDFSGSYNYRPVRGSSRLSCHAFGAAVDMDAEHNPMNYGHKSQMDPMVIAAFKRQGWFWGGDFHSRQDPMHFQAANENTELGVMDGPDCPSCTLEATQEATVEPLGSPLVRLNDPPGTSDTPQIAPPSMLKSKSGWAAIGLGGSGVLDGLQQANDYAAQLSMAKWNWHQLGMNDVLTWLWHNPMVLLPIVVIAAAGFVWEDHKRYKRLLHEAQLKAEQ